MSPATGGGLRSFSLVDFSGGWNPREAPSELAPSESPDCADVTLDERGGVVKRLGYTVAGSGANLTNAPQNSFYYAAETLWIVQDGNQVKSTNTTFGSWTTIKTFSTADRVGFCEFRNKLIIAHPVDGVFSWTTGGGLSARLGAPVAGHSIAVWQNKLWLGGDFNQGPRIWWSNAGDETTWTIATDFNDLREIDSSPITGVGAGQTMDTIGRPTLLVFKRNIVHRIHDSTTGAYTTLTSSSGAANQLCITSNLGWTYYVGEQGIFRTTGSQVPQYMSQKLEPVFDPSYLDYSHANLWRAFSYRDRVLFSLSRQGSPVNDLTLEHHPLVGWIVPHRIGISSAARFYSLTQLVFAGVPGKTKCYQLFTGGSDDGAAITGYYQTRWNELNAGHQVRVRRCMVSGRGQFQLYIRKNFAAGQGDLNTVAITGGGFTWGSDIWGTTPWGPSVIEGYQSFNELGVCRSFSFYMSETSTSSTTGRKLLGTGNAETGSYACYGLDLDYVPLGAS